MIVLDASTIIAYLSVEDGHRAAAFEVLMAEDVFRVHPVTLAETLVRPMQTGSADRALQQLANIGVGELARVDDEAIRLARMRVETRLKLPDCCVLATAEAYRARVATFDVRLADAARSRGVEIVGQRN